LFLHPLLTVCGERPTGEILHHKSLPAVSDDTETHILLHDLVATVHHLGRLPEEHAPTFPHAAAAHLGAARGPVAPGRDGARVVEVQLMRVPHFEVIVQLVTARLPGLTLCAFTLATLILFQRHVAHGRQDAVVDELAGAFSLPLAARVAALGPRRPVLGGALHHLCNTPHNTHIHRETAVICLTIIIYIQFSQTS